MAALPFAPRPSEPLSWELATESIVVRIRWFGIAMGYVLAMGLLGDASVEHPGLDLAHERLPRSTSKVLADLLDRDAVGSLGRDPSEGPEGVIGSVTGAGTFT